MSFLALVLYRRIVLVGGIVASKNLNLNRRRGALPASNASHRMQCARIDSIDDKMFLSRSLLITTTATTTIGSRQAGGGRQGGMILKPHHNVFRTPPV